MVDILSPGQPYTCFSLRHNGRPVNRYGPISEVEPEIGDHSIVEISLDAYNEAEIKLHITKVRDVLGFPASHNIKAIPTVDSGVSAFEHVSKLVRSIAPVKEHNNNNDNNSNNDDDDEGETDEEQQKKKVEAERVAEAERLAQAKPILDHPMVEYEDCFLSKDTDSEQKCLIKPISVVSHSPLTSCIRSVQLSQWNPPSPPLRMKGHLFYLQVNTLENKSFHINATSKGFSVSNCSGEKFDPSCKKISGKYYSGHSLLSLLQSLSPMMMQQLDKNINITREREALAILEPSNSFLSNPWLTFSQQQKTYYDSVVPDISRTQELLFSKSGGGGVVDSSRDWNEDFQSTRELPNHTKIAEDGSEQQATIQDRIVRERLLNKLLFDFSEEAVKGAIAVVKGDLTPMNFNEPLDVHIFLHNNIFYSYAADGVGTFAAEGGHAAARFAAGKDLVGVNVLNQLDVDGFGVVCTALIDYCGHRIVAQGPVPGIFRENPEGKSQIIYGSVDNQEQVFNDDRFQPIMTKIAEACHLKSHMVYDRQGLNGKKLATPMDTKGLEGTDGRRYVLDLFRLMPLDLSFVEEACSDIENPYPHRLCVLRFEAIDEWWRNILRSHFENKEHKLEDNEKKKKTKN